MKLSFVGAVLLISVLGTDAQGYAGSQTYSVSTNLNQQPADSNNIPNLLPPFPPPPPPPGYFGYSVSTNQNSQRPESRPYNFPASAQVNYPRPDGNNGYGVNIFGSPNQQYRPPPPPPPPPSSFLGDFFSSTASLLNKPLNMASDMLGSFRDWVSSQTEPANRPYGYNSQASYNGPPPAASSQVFVSSYPSNPFYSANSQAGAPSDPYKGFPPPPPPPPPSFSAQVGAPSASYNGYPPPPPRPRPSFSAQAGAPSDPYKGFPPPPPPPPPPSFSAQVGAPPNSYNGPPPPPPPPPPSSLASIQVAGSSDDKSGPLLANSQPK